MADWTNAAKAALNRYCANVGAKLANSGADPVEVIDDLRRHVESEVAAAKLSIVTEEDVNRILTKIGDPVAAQEPAATSGRIPATPATTKPRRREPGYAVLIFGVILPAVALGIEFSTRMCASVFFDPLPTFWNVLLVGSVPLLNLFTWVNIRRGKIALRNPLGLVNGFVSGVCAYYALLYFPLMPPGVIALIYFGWGLLPLSPLLALIATVCLRQHIRRLGKSDLSASLPGLWRGLAAAVVILIVIVLPEPLTRHFETVAASDSKTTSAKGIHWLRLIGKKDILLQDAYGESQNRDLIGFTLFDEPVRPQKARDIYFRVTGTPFNSEPPPHASHFRSSWAWDDFDWDTGLGGEAVAGRIKGLSLTSSRIDGTVEPDAALAYYEWTMEFQNTSGLEREARAQILLPSGAVVSRLTLWVKGEEREAAFGGRGQVREAYHEVAVIQRHDPVLITTCGPDRVLMQCFPVPPSGGRMKVRIGITAPMVLDDLHTGRLRCPAFAERNFSVADSLKHSVWLESSLALKSSSSAMKEEKRHLDSFTLHGELDDATLTAPETCIVANRSPEVLTVWTPTDENDRVVIQTILQTNEAPPSRIVVVVDGSANMKDSRAAIGRALRQMPENIECAFLLTTDENFDLGSNVVKGVRSVYDQTADRLSAAPMAGGQDNVQSLVHAWDLAAESTNGVVLWIHGPQPISLESTDALRQRFERHPGRPRILEMQTFPGPNLVLPSMDGLNGIVSPPRLGKLDEDLGRLFAIWRGTTHPFILKRESVAKSSLSDFSNAKQASKHIARLQTYSDVLRLSASRQTEKASALAVAAQLVTPVSGAVVLETKEQFARAGLTAADAATVPVIPEPQTWVILMVGALIFAGLLRRRRVRT